MANKFMKKSSTSLAQRNANENTLRFCLTEFRITITKKMENKKCCENAGKRYPYTCCSECKLIHHCGNQYGSASNI
jgi:hypothetical protein